MKANEILGLDDLVFIEPQFSELPEPHYNTELARASGSEGRLLLDENEEPIALAFGEGRSWTAGSFLCRDPTATLIEKFENLNGEIYQVDRLEWAAAVREYFGFALKAGIPPAIEDLNLNRRGILTGLIQKFWEQGDGTPCIDACCGSGVGSLVLRDLGFVPLSYDNDETLLSLGLATGRLMPEEIMWIDATRVSEYTAPVQKGIGIMMGEINSFSEDMWHQIVSELFAVTRETLITVGTKPEAELIRAWGGELGRTVEITENPADPIYDIWVCRALPE